MLHRYEPGYEPNQQGTLSRMVEYILVTTDHYIDARYTTAHWNDRWGGSTTAHEYCHAYTEDAGVQAWTNATAGMDFHK